MCSEVGLGCCDGWIFAAGEDFFFFLWGHGLGVAKVVVWLRGFSAMSQTMDNKVFVFVF